MMIPPTQIRLTSDVISDKEQFWKDHAKFQKESGLSKIAYCREHTLNYDQFKYWEQKWRPHTPSDKLLPVTTHANRPSSISDSREIHPICTLVLRNGHELKIYDKSFYQSYYLLGV